MSRLNHLGDHIEPADLFAHSLSGLAEAHACHVQAHVRSCRQCAGQLLRMQEDSAYLALALAPVPVPALLKESLMHSLSEIHRLYDAAQPISQLLEISINEAHDVLDQIDSGQTWRKLHRFYVADLPPVRCQPALMARVPEGVRLRPALFSLGPADGGAEAEMRHVMILQGSGRDSCGTLWHAGDRRSNVRLESLLVHPGPDLIALIIRSASGARRYLDRQPPATRSHESHAHTERA